MEYNPLNIEMAGCKSTIQKIAEERAKEMEEAFDSFDEAFDIAIVVFKIFRRRFHGVRSAGFFVLHMIDLAAVAGVDFADDFVSI